VEALRNRQVKTRLVTTLLSLGMPMFQMGDEVRRSQGGNNNAYCQDNETSWLDWDLLDRHADVLRFVRILCAQRVHRDVEPEQQRMSLNQLLRQGTITWHGVRLGQPDWSAWSHSLALTVELRHERLLVHLLLNAWREPLAFELPPADVRGGPWRRWVDTALPSPADIVHPHETPQIGDGPYRVGPRSVVALVAPMR
jgi:isoamylase